MNKQFDLFNVPEPSTPTSIRVVRIHFDGGAKGRGCPAGFGYGYGSYQINELPICRVDHKLIMSANAAEVLTLCDALEHVARLYAKAETKVVIHGDSKIALACARRVSTPGKKLKLKGSDLFQQSQLRLAEMARGFADVEAVWLPREHAVRVFGH